MLYGILHKDASTPIKSIYFNCSTNTNNSPNNNTKVKDAVDLELTMLGVRLLNQMIILDLKRFQVTFLIIFKFSKQFLKANTSFHGIKWQNLIFIEFCQ